MFWLFRKDRRGFTLIEMLIVVVVIAVIAAIVVPRLLGAGRKSKEAALKSQLQQLRSAIQRFEADCGAYPAALTDIMATSAPASGLDQNGNTVTINPADYMGPYLTTPDGKLPVDPVTGSADWTYNVTTPGFIHPSATGVGLDGTAYNTW